MGERRNQRCGPRVYDPQQARHVRRYGTAVATWPSQPLRVADPRSTNQCCSPQICLSSPTSDRTLRQFCGGFFAAQHLHPLWRFKKCCGRQLRGTTPHPSLYARRRGCPKGGWGWSGYILNLTAIAPGFSQVIYALPAGEPFQWFIRTLKPLKRLKPEALRYTRLKPGANERLCATGCAASRPPRPLNQDG